MIRLKDIKIKKKMLIVFGITILLVGGLLVVGFVEMSWMRNASMRFYEEGFVEAQKLLDLHKGLERSRRAFLTMLFEEDKTMYPAHLETITEATKGVDNDIDYILDERNGFEKEVWPSVLELKSIWEDFRETRDKELIPAIQEGRMDYTFKLAMSVQQKRFDEFISISDMLAKHEGIEATNAWALLEKGFKGSISIYEFVVTGGLLVIITLLTFLSKDIGQRLMIIKDGFSRVKAGEMDFKIAVEGRDEIGVLASDFNRMTRQLFEDKINQEQSATVLGWYAEESSKEADKLACLNETLTSTQDELLENNRNLEESIYEIAQINQELNETKNQMVQSEKMASVGQLSAGVAHEINNPIGFINSNLNTLDGYIKDFMELFRMQDSMLDALKGKRLDDVRETMKEIERFKKEADIGFVVDDVGRLVEESRDGIERVVSIVRGLKEFSHAGTSEKVDCDINKCLESTIKLCWHEIKYKAEIEKELGVIPCIKVRKQHIGQVFMNIIINAVQAIPDKGRVGIRTFAEDGNVVVRISDSGTGMPEEIRHRIFEPFFTTKPVGKGTGLGLSIVYGIVKEHGGSMDVESVKGKGTTFTIKFPIGGHEGPEAEEGIQAAV